MLPALSSSHLRERIERNRLAALWRLKRKRGGEESLAHGQPKACLPQGELPGYPGLLGGVVTLPVEQLKRKARLDYYVVLDFECTCSRDKDLQPQEIIEFPAVLLNSSTLAVESEFQVFVKPTENPALTPFCTELTGITQRQVDAGIPLAEALRLFDAWLRSTPAGASGSFAVVTWTDWDLKVMLEMECKWRRISKPAYLARWVDLKLAFREVYGRPKDLGVRGLRECMEHAGLEWHGRAHSGIDDARNTAKLVAQLVGLGVTMTVTGSFAEKKLKGAQGSLTKMWGCEGGGTGGSTDPPDKEGRCWCGVKAKRRQVKKPGPTHGKEFMSCGRWTITKGGECEFFAWLSDAPPP